MNHVTDETRLPVVIHTWGGLVAVAKPAGWRTDGDRGEARTLVGWLADQDELPPGLAPVHRLDKATSGVVLCAATTATRREASSWFEAGRVRKTYLALVHGETPDVGRLDRPLQDARRRRQLPATTAYVTVRRFRGLSLVEATPETGRKHQLRRHLQAIDHAVVGDTRYRPRRPRRVPGFPGRLWLHAWRLVLPDGREVEAPLPPALVAHLEALGPATA